MAQPSDIENDQFPDATKLMLWFNWLNNGGGIKSDTYDNLHTFAALNPTDAFDCWATDIKQRMFYTGDTDDGDGGFVLLG